MSNSFMTKAEFITERTLIISKMLDNPDKYGIYPTSNCFKSLDALYDVLSGDFLSTEEVSLEIRCNELREACLKLESRVSGLRKADFFSCQQSYQGQNEEMINHLKLSIRHLESARMRLGKVIQHSNNGVSVYDKESLS